MTYTEPLMPELGRQPHPLRVLAEKAIAAEDGKRGFTGVFGPITTGGTGNTAMNLDVLRAVRLRLCEAGAEIFDQTRYSEELRGYEKQWRLQNGSADYCWPILTEFYDPVFRAWIVGHAVFVPHSKTSRGATWEENTLGELGIPIRHLTPEELEHFLFRTFSRTYARRILTRLPPVK